MTRIPLAVAFLLALSLPMLSEAQTSRPGVDCSLLTTQQAQGLVCGNAPKADPPVSSSDGFIPSAETCNPRPNPYTEAAHAAACAIWDQGQRPKPAFPSFEVGSTYRHAYQAIRMTVLSIGSSMEGVPVVTAQFTAGDDLAGQVFAFRVDQGVPWTKETP